MNVAEIISTEMFVDNIPKEYYAIKQPVVVNSIIMAEMDGRLYATVPDLTPGIKAIFIDLGFKFNGDVIRWKKPLRVFN